MLACVWQPWKVTMNKMILKPETHHRHHHHETVHLLQTIILCLTIFWINAEAYVTRVIIIDLTRSTKSHHGLNEGDYTMDEVVAAATKAYAHDFIMEMKDGWK
jgi:hypothetical protein